MDDPRCKASNTWVTLARRDDSVKQVLERYPCASLTAGFTQLPNTCQTGAVVFSQATFVAT